MKLTAKQLKSIIQEEFNRVLKEDDEYTDQDAIDKINKLFRGKVTEQFVTAIQMADMMGLHPEDVEIYPLLPRDVSLGAGKDHTNAARIVDAFFEAGPSWEEYIRTKTHEQLRGPTEVRHFVPKYPNDPTKKSGSYVNRKFDPLTTPFSELTPEMKAEMFSQAFITRLSKDKEFWIKQSGKKQL